jgi:hypothetical protein
VGRRSCLPFLLFPPFAMQLELPRPTLKDDLSMLPLRRIGGIAALLVASAFLTWRIHDLREARTLELSPRAARIMTVKRLHDRVLSYSEQYGRPIFVWTGVRHSSAAESTLYERLRRDLVDSSVRYWYDDATFQIACTTNGRHHARKTRRSR